MSTLRRQSLTQEYAPLLDVTIVSPCANSNLENSERHRDKHLADAVKREKNEGHGLFPVTYSFLPLAMSTCGEVGSDVHALIEELAIRREKQRSEIHSRESQYLVKSTGVARLRRLLYFVLQQERLFRTHHHLCRQGVVLVGIRQRLRSQGPVSVHAHLNKGVTGSKGREGEIGSGAGAEPGVGTERGRGRGRKRSGNGVGGS